MFNPRADLKKLDDARKVSYKKLEPFRVARMDAMRQFVGRYYGDHAARDKIPVPMIYQGARTLARKVIARNPRFSCRTMFRELSPFADELQQAVNETCTEISLGETLEEVVMNAIFGWGVAKVGVTFTQDDEAGYQHDFGEVFVDCVDPSDWVHDTLAKRREAWQYCGNRYELPRQTVLTTDLFDPAARENVHKKGLEKNLSMEGMRENPHELEGGTEHEDSDLYDMVELWDLWLPREGLIVTYSADSLDQPLRIVEWEGPENGPYHFLGYQKVPNNVMPLAPAWHWIDSHDAVNALTRKAIRQSERMKQLTFYSATAEADAERVQNASDGDMVRVDDPTQIKQSNFGGADGPTVQLAGMLRDMWSRDAGNMDALGGLGPQSSTVGQDKLLLDAASDLIVELQEKTELFAQDVGRAIAYHLFTDPSGVKALERRLEGTDLSVTTYWTPDRRIGKFYQYNLEIVPYSLRPLTPEQRSQKLTGMLNLFLPMLPMMQAEGWTLDYERLLEFAAAMNDMPELKQILVPADPEVAKAKSAIEDQPKMPRSTTREYVRRSEGGQKPSIGAQFQQAAQAKAASNAG